MCLAEPPTIISNCDHHQSGVLCLSSRDLPLPNKSLSLLPSLPSMKLGQSNNKDPPQE